MEKSVPHFVVRNFEGVLIHFGGLFQLFFFVYLFCFCEELKKKKKKIKRKGKKKKGKKNLASNKMNTTEEKIKNNRIRVFLNKNTDNSLGFGEISIEKIEIWGCKKKIYQLREKIIIQMYMYVNVCLFVCLSFYIYIYVCVCVYIYKPK